MKKEILSTRKFYLHGHKEYNWTEMEEMIEDGLFDGWSDVKKDDFRDKFIYSLYEVELELEIYTDGSTKIVKVDGKEVIHKPKQQILFK